MTLATSEIEKTPLRGCGFLDDAQRGLTATPKT